MALKGVDKKEEMEMVDIEKGIEVEPQRLSAMESLEKLLEGMRLTEEVDEEALREKRSRQIDENKAIYQKLEKQGQDRIWVSMILSYRYRKSFHMLRLEKRWMFLIV